MNSNRKTHKLSAEQQFKILNLIGPFQGDIVYIRKKNRIPTSGFENERLANEWLKKLKTKEQRFYMNDWPDLAKEIGANKIDISNVNNLPKRNKIENILHSISPHKNFTNNISLLATKYKLSPKWEKHLLNYILLDKFDDNIGDEVEIETEVDDDGNITKIRLTVFENTTLDDIEDIWAKVNELQKKLPYRKWDKFQPYKNIDRGQLACDLRKQGLTYLKIGQILSEKFDKTFEAPDVAKIIKLHKQTLGKNRR